VTGDPNRWLITTAREWLETAQTVHEPLDMARSIGAATFLIDRLLEALAQLEEEEDTAD
jgi:hypothetical protein